MFKHLVSGLLLSLSFSVGAANFDCPQYFWNKKIPLVPNESLLSPRAICFSEFAVLHSGRSKTPIYTVERLNKNTLQHAHLIKRTNRFYADARLPRSERAELGDYQRSGFDRGHLVPAGDTTTEDGMAQSFSLANMIPQSPINNRQSWASIEKATRKYVMRASGDVYVISGPVFDDQPKTIGSNQVWVPAFLFKLVVDPNKNKAWVHWIENSDDAKVGKPLSYEELVLRTGIEFLPGFKSL